jgi:4-amino-4-deoxy-L-arabinose transferase-like glycosyltransferase
LPNRRVLQFFVAIFLVTLGLRLCHTQLLWPDEDYHLAAAIQLLQGKMLYRDFWYDKPPLSALTYALTGAPSGWLLRLFDSIWILAACAAAFRVARDMWSEQEGLIAAALLAFFLSFDLPGGIIPIAPDFFMVLPHLLALWCAWRLKPLAAGGWCGIAFLFNPKGAFVLAACGIVLWRSLLPLTLGFLIPNVAALATIVAQGAWNAYVEQVWSWGFTYARIPPAAASASGSLRRVLDWLGFHAALVIGCFWYWSNERTRAARFLAVWAAVSFVAVASGTRFSNRYFLQILPVLALAASRGAVLVFQAPSRRRAFALIAGIAFLVPLVRFGPRYIVLARGWITSQPSNWNDTALDRDSQAVAAWLNAHRSPADTLFVWGYRPDVFVRTRMPVASLYWDSQPVTGVPADRHLTESRSLIPGWAARNRRDLTASRPEFIVDGLSRLNPRLAITGFPETRAWLAEYRVTAQTPLSVVYQRAGDK